MPVTIVDVLEVDEIDEDQRVIGLHRGEGSGERPAVGELRERISLGVVYEFGRLPQPAEHAPGLLRQQLRGLIRRRLQPVPRRGPHREHDADGRRARARQGNRRDGPNAGCRQRACTSSGSTMNWGLYASKAPLPCASIRNGVASASAGCPKEGPVQQAVRTGTIGDEHGDRVGIEKLGRQRRDELRAPALIVDPGEDADRFEQSFDARLGPRPPRVGQREGLADEDEHQEREQERRVQPAIEAEPVRDHERQSCDRRKRSQCPGAG